MDMKKCAAIPCVDPDETTDPDEPTDLDLHCLQRKGISGISGTRVKVLITTAADDILILFLYFSQ